MPLDRNHSHSSRFYSKDFSENKDLWTYINQWKHTARCTPYICTT